jgi:hypothetical protein
MRLFWWYLCRVIWLLSLLGARRKPRIMKRASPDQNPPNCPKKVQNNERAESNYEDHSIK